MAKVWNMDNKIKYEPADVKRWEILEPGRTDHYKKGTPLTRWQVTAVFERAPIIYVGYYNSEEEAIKAVDTLDAMKREEMPDTDAELVEKEIKE